MAFVKEKTSYGKLKYEIQVKKTNPLTKEAKFHNTTWHNPDNLKGKKAEIAAYVYAKEFEDKIRGGSNVTRSTATPTLFELYKEWRNVNKGKFSDNYNLRAAADFEIFNKEWGTRKITDISLREMKLVFAEINNKTYKTITAKLRIEAKDKFEKAIEAAGYKKACNKDDFSWATLFTARKGEQIQWKSAEAICHRLGLNVNETFNKESIEKRYKKETIKGFQRVICAILQYAVENEMLEKNFASCKYIGKCLGGESPEEVEVLSESEIARLIEVAERHSISECIPILLLINLGIRKCELCGLEWRDIDFENRIISIRRNRVYVPHVGIKTKSLKTEKKSERDLYIIDSLLSKLQEYKVFYDELRRGDPEFDTSGAIFCNLDGTPRNPGFVDSLLEKFLAEAKCHNVSPHKLRHTWITTLISNHIPVTVVSKLAGHTAIDTTLKIYSHYSKSADNSKDVLEKVFSKRTAEANWTW